MSALTSGTPTSAFCLHNAQVRFTPKIILTQNVQNTEFYVTYLKLLRSFIVLRLIIEEPLVNFYFVS